MKIEMVAKKWIKLVENGKLIKIWLVIIFGLLVFFPILGEEKFFNLVLPVFEILIVLFLLFFLGAGYAWAIIEWKEGDIKGSIRSIIFVSIFLIYLFFKGSLISF